jgi:PAS domain S-box-containing protein
MEGVDTVYRDLVENQQDLLVKFNPEGRLLFVNSTYCETMGKDRESLVGSVFMPVTDERYSDVIATQMTRLFRPPFACVVEQWLQTPKGMRCISWSAKSILDGDRTVVAIVASGRDITRIKSEQRAIKKKDEELMLVLESGNRMYYSHTPEHVMTYVSPRIRALLGCRLGAGKRSWTEYLTDNPANASGLERTIRAVTSGRREPPYHLEMAVSDGGRIWVEVDEIPVVKNGKTVAISGSVVDVTDKMHIEEGQAEAELLFKGSRTKPAGPGTPEKPPKGFFRSIFAREGDGEEEDCFSRIPENLK